MQVISTTEGWTKTLEAERSKGRGVGLVPTMGSLHEGHASLIRRARAECDAVGVTVFVNPLQFGAEEDLAAYPRNLEADLALADACGAEFLFAPSVSEMYPEPPLTAVSVAELTSRWEGQHRQGHFDGVATIVTKLFVLTGACRAYFGEKDFQQLVVVRRLVDDLSLAVNVIGCPTVRESDGLALSSRNIYLTEAERAVAPTLYRALRVGAAACRAGHVPPAVVQEMEQTVAGAPMLHLDYAAVVDPATLAPALELKGDLRLLVAGHLGRARLIDNMGVTV